MKNAMSKRLTALCLALCLALPLAGCSGKEESSAANRLEAIKERGYLEVVTEPYFAPMEFINPLRRGTRNMWVRTLNWLTILRTNLA